jgi:DDE superfamily endonuclease
MVENWDETHFVSDLENGKTLGFRGGNDIKYADVVPGGMGMTMVVRLTGGPYAEICTPLMIFEKQQCSYPINGVHDNVPGVRYSTSKKGLMIRKVWEEAMGEKRFQYVRMQNGRQRQIWVDNFGRHRPTEKSVFTLNSFGARPRYLVACATDKIQPCDSFVISEINDEWTRKWELYKFDQIKSGDGFQNTGRKNGKNSGAIKNPGETWFLTLAASGVRAVNLIRDKNGISYARTAMIR